MNWQSKYELAQDALDQAIAERDSEQRWAEQYKHERDEARARLDALIASTNTEDGGCITRTVTDDADATREDACSSPSTNTDEGAAGNGSPETGTRDGLAPVAAQTDAPSPSSQDAEREIPDEVHAAFKDAPDIREHWEREAFGCWIQSARGVEIMWSNGRGLVGDIPVFRTTRGGLGRLMREYEGWKARAARDAELLDLLRECKRRFREYEMDVEEWPAPQHHRDFMTRMDAALGGSDE